MTPLPTNPELLNVARECVWFQTPIEAIGDPVHLIAYVLTYGTHENVSVLRKYVTDSDLKEALANAPPGIFDCRSWCYWHVMLGFNDPPPMPVRQLQHIPLVS